MSGDTVENKKTSGPTIRWDDSKMRSTYANVCNVSSTREEVTLLFGTNQAWRAGQKEVGIELTDRMIVSPFAAKRLSLLLNGVVEEYEKRFGKLDDAGVNKK
ncbi:DUF3467 domain-containing protein [Amphritea sp. 1_MG-2023]|uniref:DUF3467 domain-containing protein n=1 Tax=Amphritea sp. 1_MG-2023 TaxID=3062670 RepID=UPI0026E21D79|nr:DUF3467 domain-containing protein [Amphritea sp. 1_MG-2023]MDO6563431.1 DUF3467 domain-containing protein [Amphritea sp. 1_MG-2023]